MLEFLALCLAVLWGVIVVLGLLGKGKGAAVVAGVTAVAASAPFVPQLVHYVIDPEGFTVQYGTATVDGLTFNGIGVALGLLALVTAPLAARYSWGWLLPSVASLLPVASIVWLAFWFEIRF